MRITLTSGGFFPRLMTAISVSMKDFRKIRSLNNKDKNNNIWELEKQNSPISIALYKHFEKWNPEFLEKVNSGFSEGLNYLAEQPEVNF